VYNYIKGISALSFIWENRDFSGMINSLPLPVLLLVLAVVVIVIFGVLSLMKTLFQTKGTALGYPGSIIILIALILLALVLIFGVAVRAFHITF
jgi:predicted membrane protein